MAALREVLAQFGIEIDDKKLDHANEKINGFIEGLEKVGKAAFSAFAVKEVFEFAEGIARQTHEIEHNAAMLGVSTESVQQLGFAAKASGESAEAMVFAMGRLQVSAASAAKGGGPAAATFRKLGVNVKDANGHLKNADQLFEESADGIAKLTNPTERAAAATALFGRSGRTLIPFLSKGAAGIKELRQEFADLGGGFDEEAIEKGGDFEHAMAKVGLVVEGIRSNIAHGLLPILTWVANKAAAIGGFFVNVAKNTNIVRNGLILLGAYLLPLALQMALAFAPLLLAGVALAGVVLLFDDLVTMFEGGQSVIGDVLDSIFGKGTSTDVVKEVSGIWHSVKDTFFELLPTIKQVWEFFQKIAEVSGQIGDALGAVRVRKQEQDAVDSGEIKKGSGGLTYAQRVLAKGVKQYKAFQAAGGDPSTFVPSETLPGQDRASSIASIQRASSAGGGGTTVNNDVSVTVQGTNAQPHEIKKAVADGIAEAQQKTHRAAKHALTQAGQKP